MAIGSDVQFARLCSILNVPHLVDDNQFKHNNERVKNRVVLYHLLNEQIKLQKADILVSQCISMQVPIGKVKNLREVFETLTAKNMILEETANGQSTKRVKSVAFTITP
jgi:crotonobetainyl-CoA:carnitine CoA-transferase CaiB-like acyl-CoA transferase